MLTMCLCVCHVIWLSVVLHAYSQLPRCGDARRDAMGVPMSGGASCVCGFHLSVHLMSSSSLSSCRCWRHDMMEFSLFAVSSVLIRSV